MAAVIPSWDRHPASSDRSRERNPESSSIVRSRSAARRSTNVRTWAQGDCPVCFRATIILIWARLKPSRRARVTNWSSPSTSSPYTRYPAGVRAGRGRMPAAS